MKSLNQRIFEEVLEPRFPGEFRLFNRRSPPVASHGQTEFLGIGYKKSDTYFLNFDFSTFQPIELENSFWLAEKVGLFKNHTLGQHKGQWIINDTINGMYLIKGTTIPEVICKAALEVYGVKNK